MILQRYKEIAYIKNNLLYYGLSMSPGHDGVSQINPLQQCEGFSIYLNIQQTIKKIQQTVKIYLDKSIFNFI